MRRIVVATLAGLLLAGVTTSQAPSVALDQWEPDPFPLGVCVTATKASPDPVCVIVDPEDG